MTMCPKHDVRRTEFVDRCKECLGSGAHDDERVHVDASGIAQRFSEFANLPMLISEFASAG